MTKNTKRKIIIVTLKSIRVVAWLVALGFGIAGFMFFVGEPSESLGAGTEFFLAMISKTLVSIVMFIIAGGAGWFASKITQFFKENRIK